jgi:glycerol kinase
MAKESAILALDQGTTSSRGIVFGVDLRVLGAAQREFAQHYPASGWVEHDPEDIWRSTVETARQALAGANLRAGQIAAIGITNQRETCLLWDRRTSQPLHRAIVWQDRRTAEICGELKRQGHEAAITARTGLLLDPYFSATKIAWLLDHLEGARALAEAGHLAFGTIDSFLLWRLTGGRVHATDATNASRTLLYDIAKGAFDDELLRIFRVPRAILPEVRDCNADFGLTEPSILGAAVPICGVAGDQQAALIGQACFAPGMVKATYGTGCFAVLNTGGEQVASHHRLLTTIAYQLDGKRTYALEGSIFVAGAAVQWLRDGLRLIASAPESGKLAAAADPTQDVYLVPAFVGLGAPYWQPAARGALFGLTRGSGPTRSPARRSRPSAIKRATCWMPCIRIGPAPPRRCCASTAAWWPAIGPCSSWPIFSMLPWNGRRSARRPRWEPLGLPVTRLECGPTRRVLPVSGSSSALFNPRFRRLSGSASMPVGSARSRRCWQPQRTSEETHDGDLQPQ